MIDFLVKNKAFDTYPSIFHHPGRIGDGNRILGIVQLKQIFFDYIGSLDNGCFWDAKEGIKMKIPTLKIPSDNTVSQQLTIIFVTNLPEIGSGPRSLDFFGIPYRILGTGVEKWSMELKIKFLNDELPKIKTKYFMLLDSNDTFTINGLSKIISILESLNCHMLINAGQNFWPDWYEPQLEELGLRNFCDQVGDHLKISHRYVNGGAILAKTDFYKAIANDFDVVNTRIAGDDQTLLYLLYKKYYPLIQLDHHCRIFQCEFDEELCLETRSIPWYRRQIMDSKSSLYPIFKKQAAIRCKLYRMSQNRTS